MLFIVPLITLTAAATTVDAPKVGKATKVVCKQIKVTGSRLGSHKECRTVMEWEALTDEGKKELERAQDTGGIGWEG